MHCVCQVQILIHAMHDAFTYRMLYVHGDFVGVSFYRVIGWDRQPCQLAVCEQTGDEACAWSP